MIGLILSTPEITMTGLILQTGLTVFYNRHYNYWSDIAYDRNFSDWSDIVDGSDIVINKHCNYLQWTFQ